MSELFYLEDTRQQVGNDMMWWRKDSCGYTTDLDKAHVFSREEAFRQFKARETDRPWPKEYIDTKWRKAVDFQCADYELAMQSEGEVYEDLTSMEVGK